MTNPLINRKRAGALALLMSAALVVTSCASTDDGGDAPAEAVDTVRIDLPTPATSIDPTGGTLLTNNQIVSLTSASLFTYERGSAAETVPYLAESVTASEDGLTHTIVLKPDLAFSDGSELDSEDVVASLERLRDTPGANARFVSTFSEIVAVDPTTVEVTVTKPTADLSQTLALPATGIIAAEAVGVENYFEGDPVFSGPYVPEGDPLSNSFTLVRNEHFGGGLPVVKEIEVSIIPDASTSATRLQAGDVDMAQIPVESASLLSGETASITLERTATMYILPNNREGTLFSDPRIRQAIATAIDREALAKVAYGDEFSIQTGPYPPISSYPEPIEVFTEPDLDAARDLLVGTACENGCSATVNHFAADSLTIGRSALVLQQQLAEIGITLQVEPVESARYIENSLNGTFDMNMGESGSFNVQETFTGAFQTTANNCIYTGCSHDEFPVAVEELLTASDDAAREAASKRVIEIFREWVPVIPVAGETATRGIRLAVADVIEEQPNGTFWLATE